jgi:hypothetical protein
MQMPALRPQSQQAHDYQTCRDPDCPRFPCRVYKEGYAEGHSVGYAEGYADGFADGYTAAQRDIDS